MHVVHVYVGRCTALPHQQVPTQADSWQQTRHHSVHVVALEQICLNSTVQLSALHAYMLCRYIYIFFMYIPFHPFLAGSIPYYASCESLENCASARLWQSWRLPFDSAIPAAHGRRQLQGTRAFSITPIKMHHDQLLGYRSSVMTHDTRHKT